MYICIYMNMHVHTHTHIQTYIHTHHTYTHIMHAYIRTARTQRHPIAHCHFPARTSKAAATSFTSAVLCLELNATPWHAAVFRREFVMQRQHPSQRQFWAALRLHSGRWLSLWKRLQGLLESQLLQHTETSNHASPMYAYCIYAYIDLPPKWSIPKKKMAPRASVEGNPRSGAKLLNV